MNLDDIKRDIKIICQKNKTKIVGNYSFLRDTLKSTYFV